MLAPRFQGGSPDDPVLPILVGLMSRSRRDSCSRSLALGELGASRRN